MKNPALLAALVVLLVPGNRLFAALPKVDITGVAGGAHWMWVEAENASAIAAGFSQWRYDASGQSSGMFDPNPSNYPNVVFQQWPAGGAPWIEWKIHTPAAMAAPTILLNYSYAGSSTPGGSVQIDGSSVGTYSAGSGWVGSGTLPAITGGDHTLRLEQIYAYREPYLDGFLLYDGNLTAVEHPTPPSILDVNPTWMQANHANLGPVVTGPVTPQFSVTGALGANYYISKDGVTSAFTPGTTLTRPGLYRVWAVANGSAGPQERIMAGVDFNLSEFPPSTGPAITVTRHGGNLEVAWSAGWLQSATDLANPTWTEVPGAVSPWPVFPGDPKRFFRAAYRTLEVEPAYWAPDRGTPYPWFEGGWDLQPVFPEGYLAPGYLYLYVRNNDKSARTATRFELNGRPLEELRNERTVTWWRMLPAAIPPGGVGEVMIRLRSPLMQAATVRVGFDDGSNIETTIAPRPAPLRIETVGFTPAMDEVFLVVDRLTGSSHRLTRVWLDGEEVTSRCQFLDPGFSTGVSPVKIRLAKPLAYGSYHNYRVATADGVTVACTVRTYDGWVPLGTYGYNDFLEFARNGCNGHISFKRSGNADLYAHVMLGMRAVPMLGDQPPGAEVAGHPGAFAYQPMDEPDVHDYFHATHLPEAERIGYHAMEMERRFQLYREADRRNLGLLTVNLTYKPDNYYIYAPIPDIVNPDCYPFVIGADVKMVREAVEACRYAAGPRPTTFTFQGHYEEPNDPAVRDQMRFPRPPFPSEQRLMLHYAIGAGARGLFNYHHHSEPHGASQSRGTGEFPDLWREIGRTYRAFDRVAPLLALAHPTRLAAASDPKVRVSTLLAGPSAVLLVVANEDYEQQTDSCHFNVKHDLTVDLPQLPWLNVTSAWRVTETGFEPATLAGGKLEIGELEVADLYLLAHGPDLIGPLEARALEREAPVARVVELLGRLASGEFDDCAVAGEAVAAYGVNGFWNPLDLPYSGFEFGQVDAVPDRERGARWPIEVPAGQVGRELLVYAQAATSGQPARFRLTDPAGHEVLSQAFEGTSPVTLLRFRAGAAGLYRLSYLQDGPGPKSGSVAQAIYVVPADRNPPQIVSINAAQ